MSRLKRVQQGWGKKYDLYFDALTNGPEADYYRQKLDDALRQIVKDKQEFIPFEKRYDFLPQINYGPKGGGRGG